MTLNPFLNGALAAEQSMADARRDAERRRLIPSAEAGGLVRRGWLLRLLFGNGAREFARLDRPAGERRYGAPQYIGSMKP